MSSASKNGINLGKSLVRDKKTREKQRRLKNKELAIVAPTGEPIPTPNSITENKQLDEFLCTAQAATKEFEERDDVIFVLPAYGYVGENALASKTESLPIPRKPKWSKEMSAKEYNQLEYSTFMDWRRDLADLQEQADIVLTPFEKNFELWCQLWHVVDRSDIVIQIVDARDPLLYFSTDLEKYLQEVDPSKRSTVLINKSDLLTETQRQTWADYFEQQGIKCAFFSALLQLEGQEDGDGLMLGRKQLIDNLKEYYKPETTTLTLGFIGYPNVGKSSVVNALLGTKRVSTSVTPGKTKHFQTFFIEPEVCVCDCPGLVMPSIVNSKSDLVLGGTLSIDQLTDYVPSYHEYQYMLWKPLMDSVYSKVKKRLTRGYTTQRGLPDEARSSRYILKDYINGKLLYCHGPPDVNQDDYHIFPPPPESQETRSTSPDDLDSFFNQITLTAHIRSNKLVQNSQTDEGGAHKPWKKHYNRNKRTKLAKKFSHLDQ
uniref:Large subunit GTPase 1 homolog n=1 Tax=Strigamia maritima TaxID=126957 RepID=T1J4B8_STRMM